jgi:hypothetical protein
MTVKSLKTGTKLSNVLQLVDKSEAKSILGEAFASFLTNPTVTWAKFILTDDRMNGNGMRIPQSEFGNLINTGIHMPVKMALGEIAPGHNDSKPLGVITHLAEFPTDDGASSIIALAALWGEERPADVAFIKERFAQGQPVDISWEILYQDEVFNETLSSIDLQGTALRAATVVGNPAYQGRTPFLAISAKQASADEQETRDENTEDKTVEKELQEKLDAALAQIETLKAQLSEKDTAIAELTTQKETLETEIAPLKEFKEQADAEQAKSEKLQSIKTKFEEAGLTKDEEYFKTNEERLLALDEASLDFMVAELKAFASVSKPESKEEDSSNNSSKTKIPAIRGENGERKSVKEIATALREHGKK